MLKQISQALLITATQYKISLIISWPLLALIVFIYLSFGLLPFALNPNTLNPGVLLPKYNIWSYLIILLILAYLIRYASAPLFFWQNYCLKTEESPTTQLTETTKSDYPNSRYAIYFRGISILITFFSLIAILITLKNIPHQNIAFYVRLIANSSYLKDYTFLEQHINEWAFTYASTLSLSLLAFYSITPTFLKRLLLALPQAASGLENTGWPETLSRKFSLFSKYSVAFGLTAFILFLPIARLLFVKNMALLLGTTGLYISTAISFLICLIAYYSILAFLTYLSIVYKKEVMQYLKN